MTCWISFNGVDPRYSVLASPPPGALDNVEPPKEPDPVEPPPVVDVVDEEPVQPVYSLRTGYRTEFYGVTSYGGDAVLHTATTNVPLPLKRSPLLEELPVLEEIRHVRRSDAKPAYDVNPTGSTDYSAITENDVIIKLNLKINSLPLLNALRAVVEYSSEDTSGTDLDTGVFRYPFQLLYHNKDRLEAYAKEGNSEHTSERNAEMLLHVTHLLKYLYAQKTIRLEELEQIWRSETPVVAYRDIWLLFKPGTNVYVPRIHGSLAVYVLDTLEGPVPLESGVTMHTSSYTLTLWYLDCDGATIGKTRYQVKIPSFDGERPVTSLPVYPQSYHQDEPGKSGGETNLSALVSRGKRFVQLCRKPTLQEYSGHGQFYGLKRV